MDEFVQTICPNGHVLRVARGDLGHAVACPYCQTNFVPETPRPAMAAAAPVLPRPASVAPGMIGYAGATTAGRVVARPAYTGWLVALWLACILAQAVLAFIALAMQPADPTAMPSPAFVGVAGFGGCVFLVCFIPAVVLQLMWIYRVHADARDVGGYADISPGLALGLSFVPVLSYLWTAWTLRGLARFAGRATGDTGGAAVAVRVCLWFAAVLTVMMAIGMVIQFMVFVESFDAAFTSGFNAATRGGPGPWAQTQPASQPTGGVATTQIGLFGPGGVPPYSPERKRQLEVFGIVNNIAALGGVLVYVWALRRVEAALYASLSSPPLAG